MALCLPPTRTILLAHVLSSFSESDSPRAPRVQDFSVLFFRIPIRLIAGFSCCVHIPLCSLKTIGDKPPVGACYRGILAAIRDLLRAASRPAASALNVLKTMWAFWAILCAHVSAWRLCRSMRAKQ